MTGHVFYTFEALKLKVILLLKCVSHSQANLRFHMKNNFCCQRFYEFVGDVTEHYNKNIFGWVTYIRGFKLKVSLENHRPCVTIYIPISIQSLIVLNIRSLANPRQGIDTHSGRGVGDF